MAAKIIIIIIFLVGLVGPNLDGALVGAYQQQQQGGQTSASSTSSITTTSTTTTTSFIRLRANKLRRPEICRDNLPRKSDDLPALVITGRVKEVYLAGGESIAAPQTTNQPQDPTTIIMGNSSSGLSGAQQQQQTATAATQNKALVNINRVIKGNQQMMGTDIIVTGFNGSNANPCPNYVKPNDTWIMLLNYDGDRKYSIQGPNILSLNLNNLDRINAIASDEPYKRRPPVEDILCEAHYCAYGRCVVLNEQANQVNCQCPDSCGPLPSPVCGSDNTTYTNECHLIKEGCRLKRPLFVTKELPC